MTRQVICALFLTLALIGQSAATWDMNIRELQMVADHLTIAECRRVSEALHMRHFRLDHALTGDGEPDDVTCLDLLLHWDSHEGRGKTFYDLSLRLKQIDRPDVASMLSRAVYGEKVKAVRDSLLRDPYVSQIGHDSEILLESPKDKTN